jgi:hypothetical protein
VLAVPKVLVLLSKSQLTPSTPHLLPYAKECGRRDLPLSVFNTGRGCCFNVNRYNSDASLEFINVELSAIRVAVHLVPGSVFGILKSQFVVVMLTV